MAAEAAAASAMRSRFIWFLQSSDAQLEADRRRCLAPPSQPRRGSLVPDRQVSWLRIIAAGLLPKATASVDLAHGSSVTVTGSRRIRTGFPFWALYLSILSRWDGASLSHLSVVLNLWDAWPASPPPKGDRIIGAGYAVLRA